MYRPLFVGALAPMLLAASVEAAEVIRVAMFQDAQQVVVSGERSLAIRLQNGDRRMVASPLVLTPVPGGMKSNDEYLPSELFIEAQGQAVSVSVATSRAGSGNPDPGATVVVSGALRILTRGPGLWVVNEVDLEEYVKGVVPAEMNAAWHTEALQAQAVVARTYALYQKMMNPTREFDVLAGTQDQVYRGRRGVDARIEQAVERTRGLVLTYRNAPILAAFSSTAAGPTEDAMNVWNKDLPYLKGVDCPFDADSPYYSWRAVVKLPDLERTLRQQGYPVGAIAGVTPLTHSRAGRVARLRVLHAGGELILRGEDLRRVIGYTVIPSTQFDIEHVGGDVVFSGRGAGHAVGLCQWGAKELADLGYSFSTILHYYFPGTDLTNIQLARLSSPAS
jgi:stage II sporulation protein D